MNKVTSSPTNDGGMFVRGCSDTGEFVGHAIGVVDGKRLNVDTIHVMPAYQRCGWGTLLLRALIDWAKGMGATELEGEFVPETGREEAAKAFYEAHGVEIQEGRLRRRL